LVKWPFHAQAGADFVAPSDMMDGRVLQFAEGLTLKVFITWNHELFCQICSAYGPFRDALIAPLPTSIEIPKRQTYQMDYANRIEYQRICDGRRR
jgi:porphobilinogen synthase